MSAEGESVATPAETFRSNSAVNVAIESDYLDEQLAGFTGEDIGDLAHAALNKAIIRVGGDAPDEIRRGDLEAVLEERRGG